MKEKNVNQSKAKRPSSASLQGTRGQKYRLFFAYLTPLRFFIGFLALALLITSAMLSLLTTRNLYASTNQSVAASTTPDQCASTQTPTAISPTPTTTSSSTPSGTDPTPKPKPTRTPTPTPVSPTPTPVSPTPTATPTPMATPSPTGTGTASVDPTPTPTDQDLGSPGGGIELLSYTRNFSPCVPTAIPTTANGSTPGTKPTSPSGSSLMGKTNKIQAPSQSDGFDGLIHTLMFIALGLVGLSLCTGIGWYAFRRVLLPQSEVRLPPSGARPWSRTRTLSPDSITGTAAFAGSTTQVNKLPTLGMANTGFQSQQPNPGLTPQNNSFGTNNPTTDTLSNPSRPNTQGLGPTYGGVNTPLGPVQQVMHGNGQHPYGFVTPSNGFGGFSESFIPPSPQIFPHNEPATPLSGSASLPVPNNRGFAPVSADFNAMYGLPDDPFSSSQNSPPVWLENLKQASPGNGFSGQLQPPVNFNGSGLNSPLQPPSVRTGNALTGSLPPSPSPNVNGVSGPLQPSPAPNGNGFSGPLPLQSGPNANAFSGPLQSSPLPNGNGFSDLPQQSLGSFTNNEDLNSPELAEILRYYSGKSKAIRPPQPPSPLPPNEV